MSDVKPGPELRPRPQAHDAAVDRLAGVERVADRLEIEDDLQDDGDGGDEEDGRGVLDRCRRTDQPLAAADRRRRHDCARPDHLHQVARAERQAAPEDPRRPSAAARRGRWGGRHRRGGGPCSWSVHSRRSLSFICCAWGPTPTRKTGLRPGAADHGCATRLQNVATAPEARSSRGGGAPRELAGVGPREQQMNADRVRQ